MLHVFRGKKHIITSGIKEEVIRNLVEDDVIVHYDRRMDFAIFYQAMKKENTVTMKRQGDSTENPHGFSVEYKTAKELES